MLLISTLRLAILSTAFLLPQFLSTVQGYRSLDTERALLVLALPQVLIATAVALLLVGVLRRAPTGPASQMPLFRRRNLGRAGGF